MNTQKLYGWGTLAALTTAATMQSHGADGASVAAGLAFLMSNGSKFNRIVRRETGGRFPLLAIDSPCLAWSAVSGEQWPLIIRTITNGFGYIFEAPHLKKLQDKETEKYYRKRDVAKINYPEEIKRVCNPSAITNGISEMLDFYKIPLQQWQKPQVYGAFLTLLTGANIANLATVDDPRVVVATIVGIVGSNSIAFERNLLKEKNITACVANIASAAGYIALSMDHTREAGLTAMSVAGALSALSMCGVKNTWIVNAWQQQSEDARQ